jgi:hypothetical protein
MPLLTPTEYDMYHWAGQLYDPVKAHDYYEKHKHLKGRQRGSADQPTGNRGAKSTTKAAQKAKLQASITNLTKKLQQLEELIKRKEAALKRDAKTNAKKERSAKEKNKPQTAAEKAKAARDAKQYRKKHHTELKNKAKRASSKSGGSSSSKSTTKPKDMHIADLKALATKVRGQIAVAKQKLAAL